MTHHLRLISPPKPASIQTEPMSLIQTKAMFQEEARRTVANALAKGLISKPVEPLAPVQEALPAGVVRDGKLLKRECPVCHRMIQVLRGKMLNHRGGVDKRGHGNGAWCEYREIGA